MNEKLIEDLKKSGADTMKIVKDGIETVSDIQSALSGNIISGVKVLTKDIPEDLENIEKEIVDDIQLIHDILPTNKTKAVLSNGEVLEMKYYETPDTFQARIDKEEAIIATSK